MGKYHLRASVARKCIKNAEKYLWHWLCSVKKTALYFSKKFFNILMVLILNSSLDLSINQSY